MLARAVAYLPPVLHAKGEAPVHKLISDNRHDLLLPDLMNVAHYRTVIHSTAIVRFPAAFANRFALMQINHFGQ